MRNMTTKRHPGTELNMTVEPTVAKPTSAHRVDPTFNLEFSSPISLMLEKSDAKRRITGCAHRRCALAVVMFLVAFAFMPAIAAPQQNGVFYTREFLKSEQGRSQESLSEIERNLESASRLLDAGLPGAPEQLVRASFLTDLVGIRLEGEADRISQLKSSLGYIRGEEQRKLNAVYAILRKQLQTAELRVASLNKQFNTRATTSNIVQVFQSKQGEYRNLIRAGLTDVKTVLDDCTRQLAQVKAVPQMEPSSPDVGKTAAEVARLTREQGELQTQLTALRSAQEAERRKPAVQPPVTLIVTNEVVRTIEKPMPAPAPIVITNIVEKSVPITTRTVVTNKVIEYVTNVQKVFVDRPILSLSNSAPLQVAQANLPGRTFQTNAATPYVASKKVATNSEAVGLDGKRALPPVEGRTKVPPAPLSLSLKLAAGAVGLILIAGIFIIGIATHARNRLVKIELSEQTSGENHGVIVAGPGEVAILSNPPHSAPADMCGTASAIARDWFGRPVLVALGGIKLNGVSVAGRRRLRPGDQIAASESFPATGWIFQGVTAVEMPSLEPQSETI
ncbi:MAG: hypothetical protein SFY81_08305 [Verrucomicrobiota bacterium]|nr:hypothetical protein [Verrucomicrobiota bacterium]